MTGVPMASKGASPATPRTIEVTGSTARRAQQDAPEPHGTVALDRGRYRPALIPVSRVVMASAAT